MKASLLCLLVLSLPAAAADRYPSVAALKAGQVEDRDFRIETQDRRASVTVLAIHGGDIEAGTSQLARELAALRSKLVSAVRKALSRFVKK